MAEAVPAGWELTEATCDDGSDPADIELDPGETVTCTFTNTKLAAIIVDKVTEPAGDPQAFTFTPSWGDPFDLTDTDTPVDSGPLTPGSGYSVAETVPDGWLDPAEVECSSSSGGSEDPADIVLDPGETVTCVFTNTKLGTIVVEKQTNPDGDPTTFTFEGDAAGEIADGEQIIVSDLAPGTYTSTESVVPEPWALTDIECDDGEGPTASSGDIDSGEATFELDPGETVTCVFSNTLISIDVVKDANPTVVDATGEDVVFTFTVINTSPVPLEITSLEDDVFGTLSGDTDCQVGTVLPPDGGSCQFEATFFVESLEPPTGDPGQVFTPHVDTFTSCGIAAPGDEQGPTPGNIAAEPNVVCATDPATITFRAITGAPATGQPPTDLLLPVSSTAADSDDGLSASLASWLSWLLLAGALILSSGWVIRRQRLADASGRRR